MRDAQYVRRLRINDAHLHVEEAGAGPCVVLLHGGLGDCRLWDEQFAPLAKSFRTVRYDMRFFGRSERPGGAYSLVDDLWSLLDALAIDAAALVGLSLGGQVAIDAAIDRPERVWALVPVCSALGGYEAADPYSSEQQRERDAAIAGGDMERAMEIDLAVWAPLGATDAMRQLLRENVLELVIPDDARPSREPIEAAARLAEIRAPTMIVTGNLDVQAIEDVAEKLALEIPHARRVRLDSDHYLPLREGRRFNDLVARFLHAAWAERRSRHVPDLPSGRCSA